MAVCEEASNPTREGSTTFTATVCAPESFCPPPARPSTVWAPLCELSFTVACTCTPIEDTSGSHCEACVEEEEVETGTLSTSPACVDTEEAV